MGPSLPPKKEVDEGRYEYDPVPMDEPVIPPEIFVHFLFKPTMAHNRADWITRFPHKLGDSIFFQSKPLTAGWGIEIHEERNWQLFRASQLVGVLLSGGVAAIYAVFKKDVPTGVTIGGWLTAVQGLILTLLFFRWPT